MTNMWHTNTYLYGVIDDMIIEGCDFRQGQLVYEDTGRPYATYTIKLTKHCDDYKEFVVNVDGINGGTDNYNVIRNVDRVLEGAFDYAKQQFRFAKIGNIGYGVYYDENDMAVHIGSMKELDVECLKMTVLNVDDQTQRGKIQVDIMPGTERIEFFYDEDLHVSEKRRVATIEFKGWLTTEKGDQLVEHQTFTYPISQERFV